MSDRTVSVMRYQNAAGTAVWVIRADAKTLVLSETEAALVYDEMDRQWPAIEPKQRPSD